MKIVFNRGNAYFDTYYIYDEHGDKIGILEDHCRQVNKQYFVGWKLDKPNGNTGKTESFYDRQQAIDYATSKNAE